MGGALLCHSRQKFTQWTKLNALYRRWYWLNPYSIIKAWRPTERLGCQNRAGVLTAKTPHSVQLIWWRIRLWRQTHFWTQSCTRSCHRAKENTTIHRARRWYRWPALQTSRNAASSWIKLLATQWAARGRSLVRRTDERYLHELRLHNPSTQWTRDALYKRWLTQRTVEGPA